MLAAIESWAAAQGCTTLYLQTSADNVARSGVVSRVRFCSRWALSYPRAVRWCEVVMPTAANPNLHAVDWSKIPAPPDDGGARHLEGLKLPDLPLPATDGSTVSLARLGGRSVVYAYPRTGRPDQIALVDDWDMIPGARGCTPQSCAFRDHHSELLTAGASHVFGLSTQDTDYQRGGCRAAASAIRDPVGREICAYQGAALADHGGGRARAFEANGACHRRRPHNPASFIRYSRPIVMPPTRWCGSWHIQANEYLPTS